MKRKRIIKIVLTFNLILILSSLSGYAQIKYNFFALGKSVLEKAITAFGSNDIYDSTNNTTTSQSTSTISKESTSIDTSSPSIRKEDINSSNTTSKITTAISIVDSLLSKSSNVQVSSQGGYVTTEDEFSKMIVSQVKKGENLTVNLSSNIVKDNIGDRIIKVLESTGYSGYISGIEYSLNGNTLSLSFKYKGGKDQFLSNIKVVDTKVQEIINELIKPEMSDFDKELVIHNYIVNNTNYDYKNLNSNTLPDDSFTAYGALIKGTAVCSGYAEALYRLLNSAGVNTFIITGTANDIDHAWNIVNIEGSYYHLDATFDDPISDSGNNLTYNYYNITDTEISRDHIWSSENYPQCTSTNANYFLYNKLVAENKADFYNIVRQALINKQSVIRVKTPSYNTSTFSPNILNTILKDNPDINYLNTKKGFSYNYSPEFAVMEFYINYK